MGRLFGTNGVRGIVNDDMDSDLALRLGMSLGTHLGKGNRVALGTDARTSSPMLADAVASGLMATGCDVVRLGIGPSPAIQFFVKTHADVAAGVIITASHNPPEFNGIKFVAPDGSEMAASEEKRVEDVFFGDAFNRVAWNAVGGTSDDASANEAYRSAIVERVDAQAVRKAGFKVVVDPAGGAGCLASPEILERLGCDVVGINTDLDGAFRGRPSEPVEKNLQVLIERVGREKADLGVAHDGDADRCVFIDEKGVFVSGDKSFALLARKAVEDAGGGIVCTPVSTSNLVKEVVESAGGTLVTTAVGSPIVARRMLETDAVFGGEENGGLLFPKMQHCRDAAMTMSAMVELLATSGKPLSALVSALPEYHTVKLKFACPNAQKETLSQRLRAHVESMDDVELDATDGLKIVFGDGSWVLVRPSGTEPVYRVYAESRDADRAAELGQRFVDMASGLLAKAA
jgi:phosphomannomutase/phosphoglucomutase